MPDFLPGTHWSRTHDQGWSYVMKEETRVSGPWTNQDAPAYIPRAFRQPVLLRDWQHRVLERIRLDEHPDRTVHMVVDPVGNHGKSFLANYLKFKKLWIRIPSTMDSADKLMQCALALVGERREVAGFIIDIPRACAARHFFTLAQAIESIKDGVLYDWRYAFKEHVIEPAPVLVFSNWKPDLKALSEDRWKITEL